MIDVSIKINQDNFSFPINKLPFLILGDITSSYSQFENNYSEYILNNKQFVTSNAHFVTILLTCYMIVH